MSELTKLKFMRMASTEREYREKYPALAKVANYLDDFILVDKLVWLSECNRIETAKQLNLSKQPFNDFCIVSRNFVPEKCLEEELEKLSGISLNIIIRLVRIDENRYRAFYYFRQSDHTSYTMVYSAILDDRVVGLVGEIDLNHKIITRDKGFHPGVIAISTFENLINVLKSIELNGVEEYATPTESFAFRKKVPLNKRHTHKHYRVKTTE